MTDFASLSPQELADRRRLLRRQRRIRNLQSLWRVMAVSGMAVGTLWLVSHPLWLLRSGDQIRVEGNELLSDEAVRSLLPFDYPQPLLAVQPDQVAHFLNTQSPIAYAQISRQLFPPRLEIYVQERRPVAVTVPSKPLPPDAAHATLTPTHQPGLLDSQGHWMPKTSFTDIDPDLALPSLQVRGFDRLYQSQWPSLYQALQSSVVEVSEVDWRSPSNLILQTQLGTVHLGVYNPHRIQQQLSTLAQLRSLANFNNAPEVEYIDLSNTETPAIKVIRAPQNPSNSDSP